MQYNDPDPTHPLSKLCDPCFPDMGGKRKARFDLYESVVGGVNSSSMTSTGTPPRYPC